MITRKVEHFEIKEYSKKEDCLFSGIEMKNVRYIPEEIIHTAEDCPIFYRETKYILLVSNDIYEAGGFSAGYVNGKYQEFNIYY